MSHTHPLPTAQNIALKLKPAISSKTLKKYKFPLLLMLLHAPLGILLYNSSALAVLHPYAVFCLGLYWAIRKQEKLEKVALIVGYLIGVEVLWRMAQSAIFWEFGKYAASLIMIVALVQRGCRKIPTLPLLYFVFLLPSCLLTVMENDLADAKDALSFNMSGPFLLFVCCWFFSHIKINWLQLRKILLAVLIPLFSVALTTLFYTVTASEIAFNTESNFATSGGFGPNQVSSMLGLGAFISIACYLLFENKFKDKLILGLLIVLFAAQSLMTFSRGGMYTAIGASLVIVFFQIRNSGQAIKRLIPVLGIAILFLMLIFPYLNDFTGGNLQARFEESDTTKRADIIDSDLQIFLENPVFGIGVGAANEYRKKFLEFRAASHTEFSRIISEHGMFGIFSLCALFVMTIYNLKRQKTGYGKAFAAGFVVWSTLFMLNAGMRLAAPSFIWGISFLVLTAFQPKKNRFRKLVNKQQFRGKAPIADRSIKPRI